MKYINIATTYNDNNVNYKILKAKILADSDKSKLALKELKEIKKTEVPLAEKINHYATVKMADNGNGLLVKGA